MHIAAHLSHTAQAGLELTTNNHLGAIMDLVRPIHSSIAYTSRVTGFDSGPSKLPALLYGFYQSLVAEPDHCLRSTIRATIVLRSTISAQGLTV